MHELVLRMAPIFQLDTMCMTKTYRGQPFLMHMLYSWRHQPQRKSWNCTFRTFSLQRQNSGRRHTGYRRFAPIQWKSCQRHMMYTRKRLCYLRTYREHSGCNFLYRQRRQTFQLRSSNRWKLVCCSCIFLRHKAHMRMSGMKNVQKWKLFHEGSWCKRKRRLWSTCHGHSWSKRPCHGSVRTSLRHKRCRRLPRLTLKWNPCDSLRNLVCRCFQRTFLLCKKRIRWPSSTKLVSRPRRQCRSRQS